MVEAEFIDGCEYTSSARTALNDMYHIPDVPYPDTWGVEWIEDALRTAMSEWRTQNAARELQFDSDILLVRRAYLRFRKEMDLYTAGRCKLGVVREYHALLIDVLAPFTK